MELDLAIRGGTVVTASDTIRCDVGIRGERIVALGENFAPSAKSMLPGSSCFPGASTAMFTSRNLPGPAW